MRGFMMVLTIVMFITAKADAGHRWRQPRGVIARWAHNAGNLFSPAFSSGPRPSQRETDARLRAAYPKYYGAFHVREFQNLGLPSGDVGIRGNGLYFSPW